MYIPRSLPSNWLRSVYTVYMSTNRAPLTYCTPRIFVHIPMGMTYRQYLTTAQLEQLTYSYTWHFSMATLYIVQFVWGMNHALYIHVICYEGMHCHMCKQCTPVLPRDVGTRPYCFVCPSLPCLPLSPLSAPPSLVCPSHSPSAIEHPLWNHHSSQGYYQNHCND